MGALRTNPGFVGVHAARYIRYIRRYIHQARTVLDDTDDADD